MKWRYTISYGVILGLLTTVAVYAADPSPQPPVVTNNSTSPEQIKTQILQGQNDTYLTAIATLQARINSLNDSITQLNKTNTSLTNQRNSLQTTVNNLNTKIAELNKTINDLRLTIHPNPMTFTPRQSFPSSPVKPIK